MKARSAFSERVRVSQVFDVSEKRTKDAMKSECDINNIMAKFVKNKTLDHLAKHGLHYGDFPSLTFHEAMNIVNKGNEMWADLPSKIRNRFHGGVKEFLDFVQDEKNLDAMREMGLAKAVDSPAKPAASPPASGSGGNLPA